MPRLNVLHLTTAPFRYTVPVKLQRGEFCGLSMYLCATAAYYFQLPLSPSRIVPHPSRGRRVCPASLVTGIILGGCAGDGFSLAIVFATGPETPAIVADLNGGFKRPIRIVIASAIVWTRSRAMALSNLTAGTRDLRGSNVVNVRRRGLDTGPAPFKPISRRHLASPAAFTAVRNIKRTR